MRMPWMLVMLYLVSAHSRLVISAMLTIVH
jgi:hypothetical protein